ncbi:hypothetical protein Afil01_30610 [Actinorhabdospora filicis]|uniref:Uncharacterized protein n=1 Tax=Actinorhabdospora filicis TaxID=1785913 RepID=A0A9W6SJL8_9ACTN|nr:HAD family hydrolase [Actinorhabdospora filicis]GLZ78254.1 hypothetical protein Afil01_30610 [Actinorhabdospora filicis]
MPTPVRPHLAAVLARTSHVLIGFDSIATAVRTEGTGTRLYDLMFERGERFSPVAWMLASDDDWYAIAVQRDHGRDAFAMYAEAEREATSTATPKPHVPEFLAACRESGRAVLVAGNHDQQVVRAFLKRHGLARLVDHILCRQALLPPTVTDLAPSAGCLPGNLTAIADSTYSLWQADMADMQRIGIEGGIDSRKHLAGIGELYLTNTGNTRGDAVSQRWPVARRGLAFGRLDRDPARPERPAPVVRDLGRLAEAILAVPPETPGRRKRWWR